MIKTTKYRALLPILLVFPILNLISACDIDKVHIRYEMPYEQMREEAMQEGKKSCIILIDSSDMKEYTNTVIHAMKHSDNVLWNFIDINSIDNYWYKWLLGTFKSPFTLIFDKDGQIENIVFGTSEYACTSIESTISPCSEGIIRKNFGFDKNSVIPDRILSANDFIESHMQLIADTSETYYGKYLKADSLAMISGYPFSEYLKLYYGSHVFSRDSIANMANCFIKRYLRSSYTNMIYSSLIQTISKMFLLENAQSPLKVETHIAKGPYHIGDTIKIVISITNTSDTEITIKQILTSCNCIESENNHILSIMPHETLNYIFNMNIYQTGRIYQEINFITDSCMPLVTGHINIFVKQ